MAECHQILLPVAVAQSSSSALQYKYFRFCDGVTVFYIVGHISCAFLSGEKIA